nr:putative GH32 family protein [Cyphoderus albinus]
MLRPRPFHSFILVAFFFGVALAQDEQRDCTTQKWRPRFHYSSLVNWINDPNGMVYNDGVYHLYYQYHPNSTIWGPMHWGHATSTDLVSWVERGIALAPDANGMIFSGSSVVDPTNTTGFKQGDLDPIIAIYTSHKEKTTPTGKNIETQSIAYSLDNGLTFQMYNSNPVLKDHNTTREDFRDPNVLRHQGMWVMSLAAQDRIEFFSSTNLKSWKFLSAFGEKEGSHGGVWECPDLIPLRVVISDKKVIEKWLLLVSINPGGPNGGSATQYFIGDFNDATGEFKTDPWSDTQWLDWGPDNYAGVTFANEPTGRAVYTGWMSNWNYANVTPTEGWRGAMTIPRLIELVYLPNPDPLVGDFRVKTTPIPELKNLRVPGEEFKSDTFDLPIQSKRNINLPFRNPLMEVEVKISNIDVDNAQFTICAANSRFEEACFGFDRNEWILDRQASGTVKYTKANTGVLSLEARAKREINAEKTTIRLFFDTSSVEAFADDGLTAMTAIVFPTVPYDRLYINHWAQENNDPTKPIQPITIESFKVWGLKCWYTGEVDTRRKEWRR